MEFPPLCKQMSSTLKKKSLCYQQMLVYMYETLSEYVNNILITLCIFHFPNFCKGREVKRFFGKKIALVWAHEKNQEERLPKIDRDMKV